MKHFKTCIRLYYLPGTTGISLDCNCDYWLLNSITVLLFLLIHWCIDSDSENTNRPSATENTNLASAFKNTILRKVENWKLDIFCSTSFSILSVALATTRHSRLVCKDIHLCLGSTTFWPGSANYVVW